MRGYKTPDVEVELPPTQKHGNPTAYGWYGCRCAVCKEARRTTSRIYRQQNPEKFRKQRREEYARNPERFKRANKASSDKRARILARYKMLKGCVRCGYRENPVALEFHHRDPSLKSFTVATGKGKAWRKVKAEIKKCDVLCANCHRITEWGLKWAT